jgi:23S rRNA pseudoU1915 N3-methylase RlmH
MTETLSPLEQAYNEQSQELRGYAEVNQELTERLATIETRQELQSIQEEERRLNRAAQYAKRQAQDTEKFIKIYPKKLRNIVVSRRDKALSFSDIGKLMLLCGSLQKDTGKIINTEGNAMTAMQMATYIGDSRQNFSKTIKVFIDQNLVRCVGGEYFINPECAFNGINRVNVINVVFNGNVGDNVVINVDQSTKIINNVNYS